MANADLEQLYREEYGRIVAAVIRLVGDFDFAEEAIHDAFAAALEQWPREGVPSNPRAWIVGAARHKAIDRMRRRGRLDDKLRQIAAFFFKVRPTPRPTLFPFTTPSNTP